jgi:hypothetical protein
MALAFNRKYEYFNDFSYQQETQKSLKLVNSETNPGSVAIAKNFLKIQELI